MEPVNDKWDIEHLREHLQYAVDLEFWTLPFYLSAMYSIQDRTSKPYQLIRTVVNQEMLHLQCAANVANAYGLSPSFAAPTYEGTTVPHLDFSGDDPQEVKEFSPYTAEIGPLDDEHVNAMCLIEIPEDLTGEPPALDQDVTAYGSIGQFYQAVEFGAAQLRGQLRGGVRQVGHFGAAYRNAPSLVVTESGQAGFDQARLLLDLITDQGEGIGRDNRGVLPVFQNTADDISPGEDHFDKFRQIKYNPPLPEVFTAKPAKQYTPEDLALQANLVERFTALRAALTALFAGQSPAEFFPIMAGVGAAIRNCWAHGVTPKFS
ncbi:MAG: ferritin-like domain-containing protein [Myxococcales bacterium]|nr:ferritin-like domain-containing protein [Myxococcales bacterium]